MQIMFVSCEDGLILKGNYMFFHVIKHERGSNLKFARQGRGYCQYYVF